MRAVAAKKRDVKIVPSELFDTACSSSPLAFFGKRSTQGNIGKTRQQDHIMLVIDVTFKDILVPIVPAETILQKMLVGRLLVFDTCFSQVSLEISEPFVF